MEGSIGRLMLAFVCMGMLIAARWYHERQLVTAGPPLPRPLRVRGRRGDRGHINPRSLVGRLSQPLYWLGLTTSAALAGQAIASFITLSSRR